MSSLNMNRFYNILREESTKVSVTRWMEFRSIRGDHPAACFILQVMLDMLTGFSDRPQQRVRAPRNCSDENAIKLIELILTRTFRPNEPDHVAVQNAFGRFVCALLLAGKAVKWTNYVQKMLTLCSENVSMMNVAARISVQFMKGLVLLFDRINRRDDLLNSVRILNERTRQLDAIKLKCSQMVDVILICCHYNQASAIVMAELFKTMRQTPQFLHIECIEDLFSVVYPEYDIQAFETLRQYLNDDEDPQSRRRALAICMTSDVLQHIHLVMIRYAGRKVVHCAYTLAVDIQKQYRGQQIFADEALQEIFNSERQTDGIATLIGELLFLMNGDGDTFYRHYADFYARNKRDDDSVKLLIRSCPNSEIFWDWESIIAHIHTVHLMPGHRDHIKTICHIVIETVRWLTDEMRKANVEIRDTLGEILTELMMRLPHYLQLIEANVKVVGELLFVYKYYSFSDYPATQSTSQMLWQMIYRNYDKFIDFNVRCNASELLAEFSDASNEDGMFALTQKLSEDMVMARERFPNARTPHDWNGISEKFMRFAACAFGDMKMPPEQLVQVCQMCSMDLFETDVYASATMANRKLFGYTLIILSRCYEAANEYPELRTLLPNINHSVAYLMSILDGLTPGNDVSFIAYAAIASLSKIFMIDFVSPNSSHRDAFDVEHPEHHVLKMFQFISDKLKSFVANDNADGWSKLFAIAEQFAESCLRFVRDTVIIVDMIGYCLLHERLSRRTIGLLYLRASVEQNTNFFVQIAVELLLRTPTKMRKQIIFDSLDEILSDQTLDALEIRKQIISEQLTRQYALDLDTIVDEREKKRTKANAIDTFNMTRNWLFEHIDGDESNLIVTYRTSQGTQIHVRVKRNSAVTGALREGRKVRRSTRRTSRRS